MAQPSSGRKVYVSGLGSCHPSHKDRGIVCRAQRRPGPRHFQAKCRWHTIRKPVRLSCATTFLLQQLCRKGNRPTCYRRLCGPPKPGHRPTLSPSLTTPSSSLHRLSLRKLRRHSAKPVSERRLVLQAHAIRTRKGNRRLTPWRTTVTATNFAAPNATCQRNSNPNNTSHRL